VILLDTNVLVYATYARSPQHAPSKRVVDAVIQGTVPGVIVPQVLIEFMGVTTGPTFATPLAVEDALLQVSVFHSQIRTLQPPQRAFDEFEDIVRTVGRAGRRVFDYFLAAQARALGIDTICTYNVGDFAGILQVTPLTPPDVTIPPV
jgi:predicted nucleic acid-binding protein